MMAMNLNSKTVLFSDLAIGDRFTLSFSISKAEYVKHSQTRAILETVPGDSPMNNNMIGSSQIFTCGELVQRCE